MPNFIEKLIYILLFGFNYRSKIIQNFFKAKRNNTLLSKYYFIKKNIIKEVYKDQYLNDTIITDNFNHSKNFKQFIISKLIFSKFFNSILLNSIVNKRLFIFPLPVSSLKIIKKKVKVSLHFSKIIWIFLSLFIFFKSVFYFFYTLCVSKNCRYESNYTKIYLDSLSTININKINFFYFIIDKLKLKNKKIVFFHNNQKIPNKEYKYESNVFKVHYSKSVTEIFLSRMNNIKYLAILLTIIIKLPFKKDLFNNLIFFQEILEYSLMQNSKYTFDYCFFNNPRIIFKPSWAEYNEKKIKNSVIFYFYSVNIFPLITNKFKSYFDLGGYMCSSWNTFWIWNKGQLNFLKSNIYKSFSYKIVNYIPFEDASKNITINQNKKNITIFDVPPKNLFTASQLVNPYNQYNFNYCKRFLEDIVYNKSLKNFIIYVKIKRDYIGIDLRYRKLINKISKKSNVRIFYNEISAISLIKQSNLIISMPFTSTALIAKYFKKKNIYYNPYLSIKKSKFYPEGITVLTKEKILTKWLQKNN